MSKWLKKMNFRIRRKSPIAVLLIGGMVILLLFFNEDTSVKLNMEYQNRINELTREIRENDDSAQYYRAKRDEMLHGTEDLERIAREQYRMQKPTEDVYLLK